MPPWSWANAVGRREENKALARARDTIAFRKKIEGLPVDKKNMIYVRVENLENN